MAFTAPGFLYLNPPCPAVRFSASRRKGTAFLGRIR